MPRWSNCCGWRSATSRTRGPVNEPNRPANPEPNARPPGSWLKVSPSRAGPEPSTNSPSATPNDSPKPTKPIHLHKQLDKLTASRPWVRHEIAYAWDNHKPLVGIRIHGLEDRNGYTDSCGEDPFSKVTLKGGGTVGDFVPVYNPSGSNSQGVYATIKANLTTWAGNAYKRP